MLKMDRAAVGYRGRALISGISMTFPPGEIVTLIGPNGAGKSTILKSLSRQLALVGGRVYCGSLELSDLTGNELARRMAVVLTDERKPELMTCRDVAAMGRYPYTGRMGFMTPEDDRIVEAAMADAGVSGIADKEIGSVSDGQRQRVLIARAIAQDTDILILDEPTSYLDITHKTALLRILRRMAGERGISVILSLHEIDLAMKISDRIVCVKGDGILTQGTPEEVFREDVLRDLYDFRDGTIDPLTGSAELPAPSGEPEVFVISSSGRGIPVYRRLAREGTPFAAGIIYRNDMDYRPAVSLAAAVVAEEPFREIGEARIGEALGLMRKAGRVINAGVDIGDCNRGMEILLREAERYETAE